MIAAAVEIDASVIKAERTTSAAAVAGRSPRDHAETAATQAEALAAIETREIEIARAPVEAHATEMNPDLRRAAEDRPTLEHEAVEEQQTSERGAVTTVQSHPAEARTLEAAAMLDLTPQQEPRCRKLGRRAFQQ